MAIYSNTQTSLLAFLQEKASVLSAKLSTTVTVVNFDAYADLNTLPSGDVIGLGELSMQSSDGIEVATAILMAGTENDPNNMKLTKLVDDLYESVKAEQRLDFMNEETGDIAGLMICFGETIVLPVEKDLVSKILQGVSFMAGINDES